MQEVGQDGFGIFILSGVRLTSQPTSPSFSGSLLDPRGLPRADLHSSPSLVAQALSPKPCHPSPQSSLQLPGFTLPASPDHKLQTTDVGWSLDAATGTLGKSLPPLSLGFLLYKKRGLQCMVSEMKLRS